MPTPGHASDSSTSFEPSSPSDPPHERRELCNAGVYNCTVPAYVGDGNDYVIQLSWWESGSQTQDYSNAPFQITGSLQPPTITVTSPNGGETWQAGTTQTVTWTSTNTAGSVNIDLYRLVDGNYQAVSGFGSVPMSAGSYDCTVPAYIGDGNNYVIRLSWSDGGASAEDYSNAPFQITGSLQPPTITVTSPNGGETWQAGTTQTITWTSTNTAGNVSIYLCHLVDGSYQGVSWIGSAPMSAGVYNCTVPAYIGDGNNYVVWLSWSSGGAWAEDYSNAPFQITGSLPVPVITVTSPNGGESWQAGSPHIIRWTGAEGLPGNVSIDLYKNGQFYLSLGTAPVAQGTFTWSICPFLGDGTDYSIAVEMYEPGCHVHDSSDAPFTVTASAPQPTLTLTSPNGGESWQAGTTRTITWTSTNPTGEVIVVLYSPSLNYPLLGTAPMAAGQFTWDICPFIGDGTDYRVELFSSGSGCRRASDYSDASFTLTGSSSSPPSGLTLNRPVGGETWSAGSTEQITWTSANPTGNVKVWLIPSENTYDAVLVGSAPMGAGSFNWQIPECVPMAASRTYQIMISYDCERQQAGQQGQFYISSPSAPADFNRDCVIDGRDVTAFRGCATGPQIPYNPQNLPGDCGLLPDGQGHLPADIDGDGDVDMDDFGAFQRCFSGPNRPVDPSCRQ